MKTLKGKTGILPTKTLPFSLINRRKISPQLSNTLYLQLPPPPPPYQLQD